MTIPFFIFYLLGLFPIADCVLGSLRQLEDRYNTHVFHEIFGFSLFLVTVTWGVIGLFIGDYLPQFIIMLILEIAFPLYKTITEYKEKPFIYILRKLIVLIIVLWVMSNAVYHYYFC